MKKTILLAALVLACCLCSCDKQECFEAGRAQLEAQGYTNIQQTPNPWFCCGESDGFNSTGFTAQTKDGATVSGCFCSKAGSSLTIRFSY